MKRLLPLDRAAMETEVPVSLIRHAARRNRQCRRSGGSISA